MLACRVRVDVEDGSGDDASYGSNFCFLLENAAKSSQQSGAGAATNQLLPHV